MKNLSSVFILIFIISSFTSWCQNPDWNLDFEEWDLENTTPDLWNDTTVVADRVGLFPPKFHFRVDYIPERMGLARTTDATEGEYAVAMSGFYSFETMRIIAGESESKPGWSIDYRPVQLIGDYKAILLGSCDSLRTYVDVYLTKFNTFTNGRDTIGQSSVILKEINDYTQFQLNIDYINDVVPDTVIIVLAEQRFGFDVPPACLECSHVFFDNLRLTSTVDNEEIIPLDQKINLYPNPVQNTLYFNSDCLGCTFDLTLIDLKGRVLDSHLNIQGDYELNTASLEQGIYFLKIKEKGNGEVIYEKVIVK